MMIHLSSFDYKKIRDSGHDHVLLDIREPWEVAKARIDPSVHMPFTQLLDNVDDFKKDQKIIVYCHLGIRSLNACVFLREQGFKDVLSLEGGIEAWARHVDKNIPLY